VETNFKIDEEILMLSVGENVDLPRFININRFWIFSFLSLSLFYALIMILETQNISYFHFAFHEAK